MPFINNALLLPPDEVEIISEAKVGNTVTYDVSVKPISPACPLCGSHQVSNNGSKSRKLKDSPQLDKAIVLHVKMPRYKCTKCGSSFVLPISFAGNGAKITTRLQEQIEAKCLRENTIDIAERYFLSPATVSRITQEYIEKCEQKWIPYTPEVLVLQKFEIGEKKYVLCIDADRSGIVDMLPYNTKETLQAALENRFSFDDVSYCVVGLDRVVHDAVKAASKDEAMLVVDDCSVFLNVTAACKKDLKGTDKPLLKELMKNRLNSKKIDRELLQNAAAKDPKIEIVNDLLTSMYDIYMFLDEDDDVSYTDVFIERLHDISQNHRSDFPALAEMFRLVSDFKEEISQLGVFITRTRISIGTVSENAVKLARAIQKKGTGYSFRNLRARILFGQTPEVAAKAISKGASIPTKKQNFSLLHDVGDYIWNAVSGRYEEVLGTYAPMKTMQAIWLDEEDYYLDILLTQKI